MQRRCRCDVFLSGCRSPCHVEGVAEESEGGRPAFGGENEHGDSSESEDPASKDEERGAMLTLGNSSSSTQLARASADNVLGRILWR